MLVRGFHGTEDRDRSDAFNRQKFIGGCMCTQRISQHLKATCHSRGFPKSLREENERIQRHELHGEWLVGLKIVPKKL